MKKKCYIQPQTEMINFHTEPLMAISGGGDGTVIGPDAEWDTSHRSHSEWNSEIWYNLDDY